LLLSNRLAETRNASHNEFGREWWQHCSLFIFPYPDERFTGLCMKTYIIREALVLERSIAGTKPASVRAVLYL
jgi:hypothetical protein